MTEYPDDLRELYFEYGRAAEMAQMMELEAGNLALVYATMFEDPAKITDEARELLRALVKDVNQRTFGNLFRQIQEMGQVDESIITTLDKGLERRNYLIHAFFRHHNFAIYSTVGREVMIMEIREIQTALSMAQTSLIAMTESLSQLLSQVYGRPPMSTEDALRLIEDGKRISIL